MYKKKLKRNILLYYLSSFFSAGLFTIPIWVVFQEGFLSFEQIAFFASLNLIVTIILELPSGALADIIGRKWAIGLGNIFSGLGFLAIGILQSYPSMWIYTLFYGFGSSLVSGALSAIVYDSLKELDREEDFLKVRSTSSLFFQLFASFSILVGGYTYKIYEATPYILRGGLLIISFLLFIFMQEPRIDTKKFSFKSYLKQIKIGAKESFKNKSVFLVSALYILVLGLAFSNHRFFSQPYMIELGLGDIQRSWIASIIKISVSFLAFFISRNKRVIKSKYYSLLLPMFMVMSLVPAYFVSFPFALIILFSIAFPSGCGSYFIGILINKKIRSKYRATAISTLNMFVSLLYATNIFVGGYIKELIPIKAYYSLIGIFITIVIVPLTILNIREINHEPKKN
jgi:MFS family permease